MSNHLDARYDQLLKQIEKIAGLKFKDEIPKDIYDLISELQANQIELEMQNGELHNVKKELENLQEKYFDLYNSSPTGLFTLNKDKLIIDVNLIGANLLNIEKENIINIAFVFFLADNSQITFSKYVKKVLETQITQNCELEFIKKDGTCFNALTEIKPILNEAGEFNQLQIALIDIKEPEKPVRRSGIELIGGFPWGTHFCQFYETDQDLIEILVPYFIEGLKANEYCMWVTSAPLHAEKAMDAMREGMPDFDDYMAKGQMEIFDYSKWYTKDGVFDADKVLQSWIDKLEAALKMGYDGLRVTGNTFWLKEPQWDDFKLYEAAIDQVIHDKPVLVLCTYSLEKCGMNEVLDVMANHEFALIKHAGQWEIVETVEHAKTELALRESEAQLQTIIENLTEGLVVSDMDGKLIHWNPTALKMHGFSSIEEGIRQFPEFTDIFELSNLDGVILSTDEWPIARILCGESLKDLEINIRHIKTDWRRVFNYGGTLVRDTQDQPIMAVIIISDITERKNAEKRKQELLKQVEQHADELEASNEELQTTTEELLVSNEKLQDTTVELQVANKELRNMTEELQIANEKLWQQGGDLARINQKLRKSDKRMNRSQEIAHIGGWELDIVNNSLYWSDEVYRIFGLRPQQFGATYEAFLEAVHPDDRKAVDEAYSGSIREGRNTYEIEHRVLRKSTGEVRFVHEKCEHLRDESGQIIRSVGMVHDITERKKAENALIKSNERFELLSEAASTLLSSETPEAIISSICKKVMDYLDCQVFFNYLLDEKKHHLHLNAYNGISEETGKSIEWLDLGITICGCVARDGCRIVAENIQEIPDERTELVRSFGVKAYACHPILSKGHIIGTLSFGTKSRSNFNEDELELMRTVTDYVATAMERKIREEKITRARDDWEKTFDAVPDLIVILDHDHQVIRANKAMAGRLGVTPEECIGLPCYHAVHGTEEPPSFCPHSQLLEDGFEHTTEVHEDSLGGDFIVSVSPLHDSQGKLIGSVHVARDITERKKVEEQKQKLLDQVQQFAEELEVSNEELRATADELHVANEELRDQGETLLRLNRTLRALSDSDHAMVHAENEAEYLDEVCRIIIEDCGHAMVWIGYAEEDENKTIRPVAQYGFDEGYIENLNITWADTELGRGPTGTTVRTGKPTICRNMLTDPNFAPWREEAVKRGYASSMVVPLKADNKTLGAVSIYSREPDSFLDGEVKLLVELANDLAFGIMNLRLRVEKEKAEKELAESEERYRIILETANSGVFLLDTKNNIKYTNKSMVEILGYSAQEMLDANLTQFLDTKEQKNIHKFMDEWKKGMNRLNEFKFIHKDGSAFWALLAASPVLDVNGKYVGVIGVITDINARKGVEKALIDREKISKAILYDMIGMINSLIKKDSEKKQSNKLDYLNYEFPDFEDEIENT